MAIKKCAICGKEFVDYGRGKYCKGPHYTECQVCGKEFEYNPALPIPKTCSHSCGSKLARTKFTYKPKVCAYCKKEFTPTSGFQKFCSIECKNLSKKF